MNTQHIYTRANSLFRQICLALIFLVLSSCSSLRKADDRSYSIRKTKIQMTDKTRKIKGSPENNTESRYSSYTEEVSSRRTKAHADNTSDEDEAIRQYVVSIAKTYRGTPYVYGGEGPSGFDCSGFLHFVYGEAGITIPRTSNQQARIGQFKSCNQSDVGDIIVFGDPTRISHVGLVCEVGRGSLKVIHSTSSRGVIITDVRQSEYWQRRMLHAREVLADTNTE